MCGILYILCVCLCIVVVMCQECQEIGSKIILPRKYGDYFFVQEGIDAEEKEFSQMGLLTYGKVFNESEFECGDSLISEELLLPAAHCGTTSVRVVINMSIRPVSLQVAHILEDNAFVSGWGAVIHRTINAEVLLKGDSGGPLSFRNRIIEKKEKWTRLMASWYPKDRERRNRTVEDNFGTTIGPTWTRTVKNRTESELLEDNSIEGQVEEYNRISLFTVFRFAISVFAG